VVTGVDSRIGNAVAIAFAREGADVLMSYVNEDEDAQDTARLVEEAGRKAVLSPATFRAPRTAAPSRRSAASTLLVSNAAFQMHRESLEEIPDEEWDRTINTNLSAMSHMPAGKPTLLPYDVTKAGVANFVAGARPDSGPKAAWRPLLASDDGSYVSGARAGDRRDADPLGPRTVPRIVARARSADRRVLASIRRSR
jgi:hypothetical protein